MQKKAKFLFVFFLLINAFYFIFLIVSSVSPRLPLPEERPMLYSNQMKQDLKMTLFKALKSAKKSIHLVMFGLSDNNIINILKKKSSQNINLKIFYDTRSSSKLDIKKSQLFPIKSKGLMHQKIIVIDSKLVFIGSANMTLSSLMMHDNLIIGFCSKEIADFLTEKAPYNQGNLSTTIGDQSVELFLLPDSNNSALKKALDLIKNAKSSIEIAMFTFTHPQLTKALIDANNRGISIKVAIDYQSKKGASKKTIEKLQEENIPILFNRQPKLCHHKYMLIDGNILICGSANWTKSAFSKNHDCFIILYNLDSKQKRFMQKLWKQIEFEAN